MSLLHYCQLPCQQLTCDLLYMIFNRSLTLESNFKLFFKSEGSTNTLLCFLSKSFDLNQAIKLKGKDLGQHHSPNSNRRWALVSLIGFG